MSKTSLDIIPAQTEHLSRIVEIYNAAIVERIATSDTDPQTLEARTQAYEQTREKYPYIVALLDQKVVGYAHLYAVSPRTGYRFAAENAVYVDQECRGLGVGKALLEKLLQLAQQKQFHHIVARIFTHNPGSQALHLSMGFRQVGIQHEVALLDDRWFDVAIFEKILG